MNCTRDALLEGTLTLWQPSRGVGYRFNLDPVLLSGFVRPANTVIDLGTGCGVLGLLLLARGRAQDVTGVEVQKSLAELARRNGRDNGWERSFRVAEGDLREQVLPAADLVVFNPPYFPATHGRGSPDPGRDAARHERWGTLADFVAVAVGAARPEGRVAAVLPWHRGDEFRRAVEALGWGVQRRREVRSRPDQPPKRVLVEAAPDAAKTTSEAPLVVHGLGERVFSPEVQALLRAPGVSGKLRP